MSDDGGGKPGSTASPSVLVGYGPTESTTVRPRRRQPVAAPARADAAAEPTAFGPETRVPIRGVRKHTAAAMVKSAFNAPHVTVFVEVDVTETMALLKRIATRPDFSDVKASPLLLVARALLLAIPDTP